MDIDELWEELLSGDAARVRRAWHDLTDDEAEAVLAHLRRMSSEDGWQPGQRQAAAAALRAIRAETE
jgi:hypothetical protein